MSKRVRTEKPAAPAETVEPALPVNFFHLGTNMNLSSFPSVDAFVDAILRNVTEEDRGSDAKLIVEDFKGVLKRLPPMTIFIYRPFGESAEEYQPSDDLGITPEMTDELSSFAWCGDAGTKVSGFVGKATTLNIMLMDDVE